MKPTLASGPKNSILANLVSRLPILEHAGLLVKVERFHQTVDEVFFTTGWSTHPHFEMALVRRGTMRYETRRFSTDARGGQMILIPANTEHRRTAVAYPSVLDGWQFRIEVRHPASRSLLELIEKGCLSRKFLLPTRSRVTRLAGQMDGEISRPGPFSEVKLQTWILDILLEVLCPLFLEAPPRVPSSLVPKRAPRKHPVSASKERGSETSPRATLDAMELPNALETTPRERQLLTMAREYIESHLEHPIDTAQVAAQLDIGERYVNLIFNRSEEKSCGEYIRERRLLKAYELIDLSPKRRIQEISRTVGFNDPLYFSKLFRQRFGLSAKEARDRRLR